MEKKDYIFLSENTETLFYIERKKVLRSLLVDPVIRNTLEVHFLKGNF